MPCSREIIWSTEFKLLAKMEAIHILMAAIITVCFAKPARAIRQDKGVV